jgi:hypothetical protein
MPPLPAALICGEPAAPAPPALLPAADVPLEPAPPAAARLPAVASGVPPEPAAVGGVLVLPAAGGAPPLPAASWSPPSLPSLLHPSNQFAVTMPAGTKHTLSDSRREIRRFLLILSTLLATDGFSFAMSCSATVYVRSSERVKTVAVKDDLRVA